MRRLLRRLGLLVGICGAALAVAFFAFQSKCDKAQRDFRPLPPDTTEFVRAASAGIEGYHRTVETTYLSFPEWYLVFNPQEYARFLATGRPSRFPYMASVRQLWFGYTQVFGIAKKNFPFNAGNNLVMAVIGTSFTVEFALKSAWENTIGRASEWTCSGAHAQEDDYAAKVAKEYGDFVPTDPWYAFPFGARLKGLWTENSLWGPHLLRKWERRVFLTLEYGIKAGYAWLIKLGTHAVFGLPDTEVYAIAENIPDSVFADPRVRKVKALGTDSAVITVPHYQGFTDVVPGLARRGVRFIDISGTGEILITALAPRDWNFDLGDGKQLFTMPILTDPGLKRIAVQAPVKSLSAILNRMESESVRVEHLYDY